MTDDTCRVAGCVKTVSVQKRQLCKKHYGAAWRSGKLEDVNIWRHTITTYDEASLVGSCSECGPDVRVYIRSDRARCWRSARQSSTSYRHGMTRQELDDTVAAIDNRCQVCRVEFSDDEPYCVDHDHACCPGSQSCGNCIRGFLCRRCNVGIGMFGDDSWRVYAAAHYMNKAAAKGLARSEVAINLSFIGV
jgi:hypothetical protein